MNVCCQKHVLAKNKMNVLTYNPKKQLEINKKQWRSIENGDNAIVMLSLRIRYVLV